MTRLKSEMQAWPYFVIKTLDSGHSESVEEATGRFNTYPLQIPVDYSLFMHVDQPPGDVFELRRSSRRQ